MSSTSIQNVLVIGASGNVGRSTIKALLEEKFQVTGLTRESSAATLPTGVRHLKTDYSKESLLEVFKGQDAVISTISSIFPGQALTLQTSIIDAAIEAGVKIFVPSEFGIDSSDASAGEYIPFVKDKVQIVEYLKTQQNKISWTAVITGCILDWSFDIPGFGGWNLPARTATVFDAGEVLFEATSMDQVGRAIAKCLKRPDITRNEYVYVNSFTVTQNEVLRAVEETTGEKFTVSQGTVEGLWKDGSEKANSGQPLGVLDMIAGAIYGKGGLAQYSITKGLWNERLGLEQEDLREFLTGYVAGKQ